ncbi:F-type H+-transporting ATPase subunit a [Ruminococcaceae bacterium YRB3002]|nr:F-type H+-transporting ATPase subunit a [Ruminococcaceae bacterium YRB3002]
MPEKTTAFKVRDILFLIMTVLPIVCGIVIRVLFVPSSDGIEISGAHIFFNMDFPVSPLIISEAQVNSWLVMISLLFLCLYLTNGIKENIHTKRQVIAEWIVETVEKLVKDNMGDYFTGFAPFVAAIMALSAFSSLMSLTGMFPPTSDLNIVAGWAFLVFILITYYKMKCGPLHYLKSFAEPVPFLAPLNIISEVATPISMAFRHYGNILSGSVISVLIAAALQGLTHLVLGWLPGWLGEFPFLRVGIPAFLSLYFDLFSGLLQAFIFAMLTMLYIGGAFSLEDYIARKQKKIKTKSTT